MRQLSGVCSFSLKIYSFPSGAIYVSSRTSTSRYFQEKCEVSVKLFILICPRVFCVLYRIIAAFVTKAYWKHLKAFAGMIFHVSKLYESSFRRQSTKYSMEFRCNARRIFAQSFFFLKYFDERSALNSLYPLKLRGRDESDRVVEKNEIVGLLTHNDAPRYSIF